MNGINVRAEWGKQWQDPELCSTGSANYPLDGRQTIYEPYEEILPTTTVGAFVHALDRIFGEPYPEGVPDDYYLYLRQRVPTWVGLRELPGQTPIDEYGHVGETGTLDAQPYRDEQ